MSSENLTNSEVNGLMPDGSLPKDLRGRRKFIYTGVAVGVLFFASLLWVKLAEGQTPDSTYCGQAITRAIDKAGNIRYFPTTCLEDGWTAFPDPATELRDLSFKNYIPSVYGGGSDYPRVGPRPLPYP